MKELPRYCVNLKAFRTELNMSQKEIATKLGIDKSSYWRIEVGITNPTYNFLNRMVKTFPNLDLNKLLFMETQSSRVTKNGSKNIYEKIGKNLKKFRKENNITQKQLGELIGCSESNICKVEKGINKPSFELIKAIYDIDPGINLKKFFFSDNESLDIENKK